jgi:hypothetical protein
MSMLEKFFNTENTIDNLHNQLRAAKREGNQDKVAEIKNAIKKLEIAAMSNGTIDKCSEFRTK